MLAGSVLHTGMILERQMRIYNTNKINMLYIVDFIGYFVSI
jgi:hypothetical protein